MRKRDYWYLVMIVFNLGVLAFVNFNVFSLGALGVFVFLLTADLVVSQARGREDREGLREYQDYIAEWPYSDK